MNRSRYVPTLLAACTLALGGCASGGGGGGGGGGAGDGLTDNEYTRSAELFLTQAEAMGAVDRFAEALEAALGSIAEDPSNPVGYFQAARAQVGMGDYVAADSLFTTAVAMHPGYEREVEFLRDKAWREAFNAGLVPMDAGNNEQAIEMWEAAEIIYGGRYPRALMNLASMYGEVGRMDDAIDAYGKALEVLRDPAAAERLAADSAMMDEWAGFEKMVVTNRTVLLVQAERHMEAASDLAIYLESNPDDIEALSNRAAVLIAGGMPDSAQAIYDRLLSNEQLGAGGYYGIGVGLYNADDLEKAAEAFAKVVEISPQNREAVFMLAYTLQLADDFEACVPAAMNLIDLDRYHQANYRIIARCLAGTGDGQEGARYLQEMQNLDFSVIHAPLAQNPAGGGTVTAEFVNKSLAAGTMVTIRVHFNGDDGATVGTASLRVEAPEPGETTSFEAELTSDQQVIGYYFQIVPPR